MIAICEQDTLDDLCWVILNSFDFDHDHMYEFAMDNKVYNQAFEYKYVSAEEGAYGFGSHGTKGALHSLQLQEKQKFLFHYDFGDDWLFQITVSKIQEVPEYIPHSVIKEKGSIEQYPY